MEYICYSQLNFILCVHPGKELSVYVVRNSLYLFHAGIEFLDSRNHPA